MWWSLNSARTIGPSCDFDGTDLGGLIFVGNFVLVMGMLLVIFLLHVAITSGFEAYWLSKVRYLRDVLPQCFLYTEMADMFYSI